MLRELKHEIRGKTLEISMYGLVECASGHSIKPCQIGVEDDFVVTEVMNQWGEFLRNEHGQVSASATGFALGDGLFPGGHGAWVGFWGMDGLFPVGWGALILHVKPNADLRKIVEGVGEATGVEIEQHRILRMATGLWPTG